MSVVGEFTLIEEVDAPRIDAGEPPSSMMAAAMDQPTRSSHDGRQGSPIRCARRFCKGIANLAMAACSTARFA